MGFESPQNVSKVGYYPFRIDHRKTIHMNSTHHPEGHGLTKSDKDIL